MRRGSFGPNRLGQRASEGVFIQGNGFNVQHTPQPGIAQRGFEAGQGFGEGNIVEID